MNQNSHYHFNETITVPFDEIKPWIRDVFAAEGLKPEEAELVAETLVDADARGVYSHGIQRVKLYSKRIETGCINKDGTPFTETIDDATAVVNGDDCMGQTVGVYAMDLAIDLARKYGVSFVVANHSNHYGRCAYFARMALEHDMIGFSCTIGGGNLMAPWGGTDSRVGNNPFSVAIPAGKYYPVVLDSAQSVVAKGKVDVAAKTHAPIPADWAFDKYGNPTTDAEAALEGSLRPIADYKGSGIAIIISLLSSVISNAAIGANLKTIYKDFDGPLNKGQCFMAVDLARMTDIKAFKERMDTQIAFIKASPAAPFTDEVYLPGEIEWKNNERQLRDGIVYPVEILKEINTIATNYSIPVPKWLAPIL